MKRTMNEQSEQVNKTCERLLEILKEQGELTIGIAALSHILVCLFIFQDRKHRKKIGRQAAHDIINELFDELEVELPEIKN